MSKYDVIVVGGGATGVGVALEAQTRGYNTLLLEAYDFGKGTSSKATKILHGGIRYLSQLHIKLIQTGIQEKKNCTNNAPHLCRETKYLIPCYSNIEKYKYLLGVKLYNNLNRTEGYNSWVSKSHVLENCPDLLDKNLKGSCLLF